MAHILPPTMSPPNMDDIEVRYLYVLDEVERIRVKISWMYTYYLHWAPFDSSRLYLRRNSWAFMRTNIQYVTDSWAHLNTLVSSEDPPEIRALLNNLELLRPNWHWTKTFLETVLQRSAYLHAMQFIV